MYMTIMISDIILICNIIIIHVHVKYDITYLNDISMSNDMILLPK